VCLDMNLTIVVLNDKGFFNFQYLNNSIFNFQYSNISIFNFQYSDISVFKFSYSFQTFHKEISIFNF